MTDPRPIVWSIAGTDSGGGAGLAADQRAADAFGVHLCGLVAAVTAQHSRAVTRVEPVSPALFDAQWQALADDLPPRVVKTGLLGSVAHVRAVAAGIDRLRAAHGAVPLVVDPVLGASTGARFADAEVLAAFRAELLPRTTVLTPNRAEALRLAGAPGDAPCPADAVPALARRLRAMGAGAVCITGGDSHDDSEAAGPALAIDWLAAPQAEGWLALPREAQPHHHGSGCTFATALAAALALGFVEADAAVLAKMAATHAIRRGYAAGGGAGPVHAGPGFGSDPSLLPQLSWAALPAWTAARRGDGDAPLGLYALTDRADAVPALVAAGARTLQLRIKRPPEADAAWHAALAADVRRSVAACRAAGALLVVNDHWREAQAAGAEAVHLGQEDLLALGEAGRAALAASGLALGVSSHSLWELCRARVLAPRYVACGPVWPTLTKAMPWRPQGLHNLAWWRAMAGVPVVAIGGILDADRVREAAAAGADGVCVVRAVADDAASQVPPLQRALTEGRWVPLPAPPALPRPSLPGPAWRAGDDGRGPAGAG